MRDHSKDFAIETGQAWLNAASEGPIPKVAAAALQEAIGWKLSPQLLTIPKFQQVPLELKKAIARLVQVPQDEVILGNSATYGVHLLANGLGLNSGDEVLLMQNDFPSDILPWLHLKKKGVVVRQVKPKGEALTLQELRAALTSRTKAVCLPYVHTFSGWRLDIAAMGELCRRKDVVFIVNMSQAIGAFDVDIASLPVDAVVCAGYKWLLGPYGTGFCWIKADVRRKLDYPQAYWISLMDENTLASTEELTLKEDTSARRYDVFATANFFNFVPWRASIEYLLDAGMEEVGRHNRDLVDRIVDGLDGQFELISPSSKPDRTNIVVFSHKDRARNEQIFGYLKEQGLHGALWKGKLRVAPHIYNTAQDIDRLLSALRNYDRK